jgi:hypothetical protein
MVLLFIPFLSSCSDAGKRECKITPEGVSFFIEDRWGADRYSDVTVLLREKVLRGGVSYDEALNIVSSLNTKVTIATGRRPNLCKANYVRPRSLNLTFSPRSDDQVGAELNVYFDKNDQVGVVEFLVSPLAL